MHIGIGLPSVIRGVSGPLIVEWARRADAGPFSSLAVLDRLIYSNHDPFTTLAAAATVTSRVRLLTSVLLAPLRNTGVLAKQAASIDVLSRGRLTLGLGVGSREDDFSFVPSSFKSRGKHTGEQIALMKRLWSGERVSETIGNIGPQPVQEGGPEILIGGRTPVALRRATEWINGYISGGGSVQQAADSFKTVTEAWQEAGKPGKPRFVGCFYCAIADDESSKERAAGFLLDYYAFRGQGADEMVRALPTSTAEVTERIRAFADIGADEVILWPCLGDLDQVDRMAELATSI